MKSFYIVPVICLIALCACKKNPDPEVTPNPPGDTTHLPALFTGAMPILMSDYERSNQLHRTGHLLTQTFGGGLPFDPMDKFIGVFDCIEFLKGFSFHKMDFSSTFAKLNNLSRQDSLLDIQITNLASELDYSTSLINNQINSAEAIPYMADITSRIQQLSNLMQAGVKYQNNVPGYNDNYMTTKNTPAVNTFDSANITTPFLDNDFNALYLLICPTIPFDTGCLMTFAKVLVHSFDSVSYRRNGSPDSVNMMNTYLILESYFYSILNYQMMAATVKMNVLKDSDTLQAQSFWNNTVVPAALQEADALLEAAAYMLLSFDEYRTQNRWVNDINWSGLNMAPNTTIFGIMARAQFTAHVIRNSYGANDNAIWGTMFVPRNYCSSPPVVVAGGASGWTPWITQLAKSRIPYTLWSNNGNLICAPDNQYHIYHFSIDPGTAGGNIPFTIAPTWPHTTTGQGSGSVTPLWYNPRDPSITSPVKTDSCKVCFASFCLSWQWGVLLSDYMNIFPGCDSRNVYSTPNSNTFYVDVPRVGQWHSSQNKWENLQTNYGLSYGSNAVGGASPFKYSFSVNAQAYSSGAVYVIGQVGVPVVVSHYLPSGNISLYTRFNCTANFNPWSTLNGTSLMIGSNLNQVNSGKSYVCSADCFNGPSTQTGFAYGSPQSTQPGNLCPSFQYYYNIYKSSSTTATEVIIYIDAQEIFTGYAGY